MLRLVLRDAMKLLNDLLAETHWPSWLRGASVALIVSALYNFDIWTALSGLILYVIAYGLQVRIPYRWR